MSEAAAEEKLSTEDRLILDRIQSDFPLVNRPFDALGEELGMDGDDVLRRVKRMEDEGFIREFAPVLSSKRLGFGSSALVAARVPEDKLEETADFISGYEGVTHNYERVAPRYNLWFTLHCRDDEQQEEVIDEIKENTAAEEVLPLPATRVFRIGVRYDLKEKENGDEEEEDE